MSWTGQVAFDSGLGGRLQPRAQILRGRARNGCACARRFARLSHPMCIFWSSVDPKKKLHFGYLTNRNLVLRSSRFDSCVSACCYFRQVPSPRRGVPTFRLTTDLWRCAECHVE